MHVAVYIFFGTFIFSLFFEYVKIRYWFGLSLFMHTCNDANKMVIKKNLSRD